MGLFQFVFLTIIMLVYILLFGGLIARIVKRNAAALREQGAPSPEELSA